MGEDIRVDYMTVNCPFPVTNRAFCLVRANKSQEDGAQIHISCSINHKYSACSRPLLACLPSPPRRCALTSHLQGLP